MTIHAYSTFDRKQWLNLRRKAITGSEVGALFGVHKYTTAAQLYAEKSGAVPAEEDDGSAVMTRGTRLEPFVASQLAERHPDWNLSKSNQFYFDTEHRLGGTPDYFMSENSLPVGILEIKTVGMRDFIDIWRGGDPEGEIVPEPWQMLQVLTYVYLTNARFGKIAVLPVSDWAPMDIYEIDIPRKDAVIKQILDRTAQFWSDVDDGIMPEFDYAKDSAAIRALYSSARPGSEIDMTGDNEMIELMEARDSLKSTEKNAKAELVIIENQIRSKIGDFESVKLDGWKKITLKNVHRKEYTVAATDYRELRATREKQ